MDTTGSRRLVRKNLQVLGISPEASQVYIELVILGPSTILQLAQATTLSRQQVYRHIEQLNANGLVATEQLHYGSLLRALPIGNLKTVITDRETEITALKNSLESMQEALAALANDEPHATTPKNSTATYHGIGGLKQFYWQLCNAGVSYCSMETNGIQTHIDDGFLRRCHTRQSQLAPTIRALSNRQNPINPNAQHRYLDASVLQISHDLLLYGNSAVIIEMQGSHILITELQHTGNAAVQQHFFDVFWNLAEPLD